MLYNHNRLHAEEVCYPDQYPFDGCVDVTAIQWDAANSVEELAATFSGTVSLIGGHGPYTWAVGGNGFYLDSARTLKTLQTTIPSITIYTQDACGAGNITVTDACGSQTTGTVRSEGHWELQGEGYSKQQCPFLASRSEWEPPAGPYQPWTKIEGDTMVLQLFGAGSGNGYCDSNITYQGNICEDYLDFTCPDEFDGCITDWCAGIGNLQEGDQYTQCGGLCRQLYIGHCHEGSPVTGPLVAGCYSWKYIPTIAIYKWKCN